METSKILASALVGTTAMTMFSYLVSEAENKNFREPDVLGELIERLPERKSNDSAQIGGWLAHYAVGIVFVACFNELWKRKIVNPSVTTGALLGAASCLAGISAWKGSFVAHPNPPSKNLKPFFGHLVLAHAVFGIFSSLTYKLITKKEIPGWNE